MEKGRLGIALQEITARIETLQAGIQTYCEAHRDELTSGGKTKTANLVTGEVSWRQRPPSVSIRSATIRPNSPP